MFRKEIKVLKNCISSPCVLSSSAGRDGDCKFMMTASDPAPAFPEVSGHGLAFMLREDVCAIESRIETVGKCKIQNAETSAEWNQRLRPVPCERTQAPSLSSAKDESNSLCSQLIR
jgi:hypothetical protein